MSENIYAVPEADLEIESTETTELATRGQRLGAAFADGMLIMIILIGFVLAFVGWQEYSQQMIEESVLLTVISAFAYILVFLLLNGRLLMTKGQTLGKRSAKIRIVDVDNGETASTAHLAKRYGFTMLTRYIPVVGGLIWLVNVLFIFGKNKRCLHDFVGGTKVVKCAKQS